MVKQGEHATVAMGLVDRLRTEVLAGRLPSGARLRAAEMARREGVSLTVVREALVALVGQGLVVNEPQAGFAVTSLSVEDLLDLTAVRVQIEALALRGAVRSGDLAWEATAVAAHHVLVSLPMTTPDGVMSEVWTRAHAGFHDALAAGCCSPTLLAVRRRLYDRAELYRWWSIVPGQRHGRDVACEHRELLEAMLSRNADLAVARMTKHIETTTMLLLTSRQDADRKGGPDLGGSGLRQGVHAPHHSTGDLVTRQVVLTFDNGPTPGVTEQVLEVLHRHGALATFFVVGQRLDEEGQRLADLCVQQGHWIGNHSYHHADPLGLDTDPDAAEAEIGRTERLIGARAHPARLFRPWGTGGALDDRCLSADALRYLKEHRYTCVLWNSVPRDWERPDGWVATALSDIARRPENEPTVVVLHDIDTGAMNHLDEFLTRLREGGIKTTQAFPSICTPLERGELTDAASILRQLVAGSDVN